MAKKVMIVDDDKEFLTEVSETLVHVGYDVIGVSDPSQVVEKTKREKPDVILLDLKMPRINGFSLAAELRRLPEGSSVPIIAVTGYFKEDYLPLMNICGIHSYLRKPFNVLDAVTQIETARNESRKR